MKFLMLGTTVPEPTSEKTDQYVCSAGIELDDDYEPLRLVRLYPFKINSYPKRWSVSEVDAIKHPRDSRIESYYPNSFKHLGWLGKRDRQPIKEFLENYVVSGISEANDRRMSLAIVRPAAMKFILESNDIEGEPTYKLFANGEPLKAKQRFQYTPRLQYTTEDGKRSRSGHQVREWGIYELMRNNQDKIAALDYDAQVEYVQNPLHLSENSLLFIGNFANHRMSWLIISVLNIYRDGARSNLAGGT